MSKNNSSSLRIVKQSTGREGGLNVFNFYGIVFTLVTYQQVRYNDTNTKSDEEPIFHLYPSIRTCANPCVDS